MQSVNEAAHCWRDASVSAADMLELIGESVDEGSAVSVRHGASCVTGGEASYLLAACQ